MLRAEDAKFVLAAAPAGESLRVQGGDVCVVAVGGR